MREEGQLPITIRADSLDVINEVQFEAPEHANQPNLLLDEQGFDEDDYDNLD